MIVRTLAPASVLDYVATSLDIRINNLRSKQLRTGVNVYTFTIRPASKDCKYYRLGVPHPWAGHKQRRVHAVCWHGHRDFFRSLFQVAPDASVKTAWAQYNASNFEDVFPETGWRNIGSQILPCYACEACDCPDSGSAS